MTVKKEVQKIPFAEIEPMLNTLRNGGFTEPQVMTAIGYASNSINGMRQEGRVRLSFKYALLGLLAEVGEKSGGPAAAAKRIDLGYDQAELMFSALKHYRKVVPARDVDIKKLMAVVSQEMVRLA